MSESQSEHAEADFLRPWFEPVERVERPPPPVPWWPPSFHQKFEPIFEKYLQFLQVPRDKDGQLPEADLWICYNPQLNKIEYYAKRMLFQDVRPRQLIRIEPFAAYGYFGPSRTFSILDLLEYLE